MRNVSMLIIVLALIVGCKQDKSFQDNGAFPYQMPEEKPNRPLSAAIARNYDAYMGIRPEANELYIQFKYTKLNGFDYNNGDGTLSRCDLSKVIFANGKF